MKMFKLVLLVFTLSFLSIFEVDAATNGAVHSNSSGGGPAGGGEIVKPLDFSKKKCEDLNITRGDILQYIQKACKKVSKGKNDLPITIRIYAGTIDNYAKIIDIEEETKIKRTWFKSISQIFNRLYIYRSALNTARMNKNAKQFAENKTKYYKLLATLKKVYENPPKIKEKIKKTTSRRSNHA